MSAEMTGLLAALGCAAVNGAQLGVALKGWGQSQASAQSGLRAGLAFALCALNVAALAMALAFLPAAAAAKTDWLKGLGVAAGLAPQWIFAVATQKLGPILSGDQKLAAPAWLRRLAEASRRTEEEGASE